jgi:hypothetical protein
MPPDDTTEIRVTLARHEGRIDNLELRMDAVEDLCKLIADLRVGLGKLEMQLKITWGLMVMIIAGLMSVAFSYWSSGGGP